MSIEQEALLAIERISGDSTCECDDCLDIAEILKAARLNQGRDELRRARTERQAS